MGISSAMGSQALVPAGFGFRNLIINGDFRIAQRGTSFVSGANNDDTYNLDRWTILSDGNDVVDITQATDVPTGGLYSIGLDVETANKKFGIVQFVEQQNIVGVQNKNVWLSFKARTTGSSISNVKAVVLAWTGTADTVTSDVVSSWGADGVTPTWAANWTAENTPSNLGVTNSWAEYRVSAVVDTASVKNLAVFIWCDDTSTTVGDFLYVTDAQLEINEVATNFEHRPVGVELALCRYYYYSSYPTGDAPGKNYSGTAMSSCGATIMLAKASESQQFVWHHAMRSAPTVTYYSLNGTSGSSSWAGSLAGTTYTDATVAYNVSTKNGWASTFSEAGAGTGWYVAAHFTASAEL